MKNSTISLSGVVTFAPIAHSEDSVQIPRQSIEPHELVYRMGATFAQYIQGDLLIVDPRQEPVTGQTVLATFQGGAYIGTWWAKHRKRELVIDASLKPMRGVEVSAW